MPRTTKQQQLAERQDTSTRPLFDEEMLPVRHDWVDAVRTESYRHTGARLLDDERKCLRLVELLTAGWGVKRISRELQVSKHTVRGAREALVQQGKLAPLQQRLVSLYNEILEAGAARYLEGMENGNVAYAQIPVGIGIISDKRALLLGMPTEIAVKAEDRRVLSVEHLNAWVEALPSAAADAASTVLPGKGPS